MIPTTNIIELYKLDGDVKKQMAHKRYYLQRTKTSYSLKELLAEPELIPELERQFRREMAKLSKHATRLRKLGKAMASLE